MPDARDDRRASLIAGAIFGGLSDAERAELDALRADDPTIDEEIRSLGEVSTRIGTAVPQWDSSGPSDALRDRILAIGDDVTTVTDDDYAADRDAAPSNTAPGASTPPVMLSRSSPTASTDSPAPIVLPRRRPWLMALAAVACVGIGAGGVLLSLPTPPGAPTGPPGTLGAIEQINFNGEPSGVDIDGSLVAHTWGTETLLRVTGLVPNDAYGVVLVTADGELLDSGSFLGSTVPIDCAMNAAVMREDVTSVEILDAAGTVVASAALPTAG